MLYYFFVCPIVSFEIIRFKWFILSALYKFPFYFYEGYCLHLTSESTYPMVHSQIISAQVFHPMFVFQLGFPDVTSCTYVIKNWVNALNKTFTQIPQTHMVSTLSLWLRKCIQIRSLFSSLSRLTFVCYLSFCVFDSFVLFCFVRSLLHTHRSHSASGHGNCLF